MSLKISLYGLEYKLEVEQLGAFISQMKGIMSQLASVQALVADEDAIAILLKAVMKVYPTLVTTLSNVPDPTLPGVIQSCLDEEKRTSHPSSNVEHPSSQALVNTSSNIKCSYCCKKGHVANNCWKKFPNKMKCNKCKQTGHITSKCPNKEASTSTVNVIADSDSDIL